MTKRIPAFLEKRTPALLLGLGAAIAVAAGGLAAYWVLLQRRPIVVSLPVGSHVVPQDALATLTFSTEPDQWRELRQFGTPETQKILEDNLTRLRDRLLTTYGYDYQQDIQPWIGDEATIALLSTPQEISAAPDANPPSADRLDADAEQPIAVVLPIADLAEAQNVLADSQTSDQQWTTRDYKGVEIREAQTAQDQLSVAVLGTQFLIVATDTAAIERVIDTYRGEDSVAEAPGYRQAAARVAAADPFLRLYVNAPVARAIATANTIQPLPTQGFSPLRNNQGIAATLTLESAGVQIQGIGWLASDSEWRYDVKNTATQLPRLLPDDTLLMVSGGNLQRLWQDYGQQSEADPRSLANPANFRQAIQETTGLDLDQDVLSWMDGEFSLALIPTVEQTNVRQTAGILFMVKASDRPAAEQALAQLDEAMSDRYQFKVSQETIKGQPVVKWTSPFAALTVTHGWMDGDIAFMTLGAPITDAILPKPTSSLAESDMFERATASDLKPNNGHFFIDVDRLINSENDIPLPNLPNDSAVFFRAIQAIGVTSAIQDDRSTRYDIQVLLRKTDNSRP